MKKYLNKLSFITVVTTIFFSACKKEETKIYYNSGTAPVLSASLKDTIPLVATDSTNSIISFSWTNPNYVFSNGLNSQNVNYYLEFDTLGANFTNSKMQQVSVGGSALDTTLTVGSINSILANGLGLSLGQQHNVQVRLESFLGTGAAALYSNAFNYKVTPYAPPPKIAPPYTYPDNPTGTLYIVGDATAGNWDNPIDKVTPASQQFTQDPIDPTIYSITIALQPGGSGYKFIGVNGSWNDQWSVKTDDDQNEKNGGDFIFNGNNIAPPDVAGTYVIVVNFQTGKFTVTPK